MECLTEHRDILEEYADRMERIERKISLLKEDASKNYVFRTKKASKGKKLNPIQTNFDNKREFTPIVISLCMIMTLFYFLCSPRGGSWK